MFNLRRIGTAQRQGLKRRGAPAATIDQISIDGCFQPGVKLGFGHFDDGCVATPDDIVVSCGGSAMTYSPSISSG